MPRWPASSLPLVLPRQGRARRIQRVSGVGHDQLKHCDGRREPPQRHQIGNNAFWPAGTDDLSVASTTLTRQGLPARRQALKTNSAHSKCQQSPTRSSRRTRAMNTPIQAGPWDGLPTNSLRFSARGTVRIVIRCQRAAPSSAVEGRGGSQRKVDNVMITCHGRQNGIADPGPSGENDDYMQETIDDRSHCTFRRKAQSGRYSK